MVARLPNDCWASIQFLKWQKLYERERPFHILIDVPKDAPDQRTTNLVYEDVDQYMTDVRGYEDTFDLDGNGFKYLRKNIDFQEFNDAEAVHAGYFPEVERILRENVEEADEIFLFGWRVCKQQHPGPSTTDPTSRFEVAARPLSGLPSI